MPLPSSLSQYDDVRAVLEAALDAQEPEVRYVLASSKAALAWRHRANRFRVATEVAAFKNLSFSIRQEEPEVVLISRREIGRLETASGEALPIRSAKQDLDPLELAALELRKELGIEE